MSDELPPEEKEEKNRKLFRDIMKEKHGIDPVIINEAHKQLLKKERKVSWSRWYYFTRFLQGAGYFLAFSAIWMLVAVDQKTSVHWVLGVAAAIIGWGIAGYSTEELKEYYPEKFPNMSDGDDDLQ